MDFFKELHFLLFFTLMILITGSASERQSYGRLHVFRKSRYEGASFAFEVGPVGSCKNVPQIKSEMKSNEYSVTLDKGLCIKLSEKQCHLVSSRENHVEIYKDTPMFNLARIRSILTINCFSSLKSSEETEVIIYSLANHTGNSVKLPSLKAEGDCVELKKPPPTYPIQDRDLLKSFNKNIQSVSIPSGLCIRLGEGSCDRETGRTLDLFYNSPAAKDVNVIYGFTAVRPFGKVVQSIKIIPCPTRSGVFLYSEPEFQGRSIELTGLEQQGDCVDLFAEHGYASTISDDVRNFTDLAMSISFPTGACVMLFEDWCDHGKSIEICSELNARSLPDVARNLSLVKFGGILSSVRLTRPGVFPLPTPRTPPAPQVPPITLTEIVEILQCVDIPESLFYKTDTLYEFLISDTNDSIYLDLKLESDSSFSIYEASSVHYAKSPDVIITLDSATFYNVLDKQIMISEAFLRGKLSFEGNEEKLLKLYFIRDELLEIIGDNFEENDTCSSAFPRPQLPILNPSSDGDHYCQCGKDSQSPESTATSTAATTTTSKDKEFTFDSFEECSGGIC